MLVSQPPRQCGHCAYFRNDPATLEAAFPGLTSLSSAYGSARGDDGLCLRHDRYLGSRASCADFAPRAADRARARPPPFSGR